MNKQHKKDLTSEGVKRWNPSETNAQTIPNTCKTPGA